MQDKPWFGTAYYPEYLPNHSVDEDMCLMKEAGFNLIRVAESTWSTRELREGEFDFSLLEKILDAAQEHGLSVIVGTPTYAIPPWPEERFGTVEALNEALGLAKPLTSAATLTQTD